MDVGAGVGVIVEKVVDGDDQGAGGNGVSGVFVVCVGPATRSDVDVDAFKNNGVSIGAGVLVITNDGPDMNVGINIGVCVAVAVGVTGGSCSVFGVGV